MATAIWGDSSTFSTASDFIAAFKLYSLQLSGPWRWRFVVVPQMNLKFRIAWPQMRIFLQAIWTCATSLDTLSPISIQFAQGQNCELASGHFRQTMIQAVTVASLDNQPAQQVLWEVSMTLVCRNQVYFVAFPLYSVFSKTFCTGNGTMDYDKMN